MSEASNANTSQWFGALEHGFGVNLDHPGVRQVHEDCASAYGEYLATQGSTSTDGAVLTYPEFYFAWSARRIALADQALVLDSDE